MRPQGGRLSGAERRAVAEYLSGRSLGGDVTGATHGRCAVPRAFVPPARRAGRVVARVDQHALPDGEQAGLTADDVPRLTLKWAFGFPDATSAWSQPTVAGGRLFVGSQNGTVYALDAKSGCVLLDVHARRRRPHGAHLGCAPAAAHDLLRRHRRERLRARRRDRTRLSGRGSWTSIRTRASPDRRRSMDGRLYVPMSSLEETAASQPGYECCTFRGSLDRARRADRRRRLAKLHGAAVQPSAGKSAHG